MLVFIILFMCRHCDTVICSLMLCEWLLYSPCVVTSMKLYTPNENFSLASGKYILYTTAVTLRHTAS